MMMVRVKEDGASECPAVMAEIGNDKVQGMDYFYTLQGWIKGVNGIGENSAASEPGQDGHPATQANRYMGKDEFGYMLGYHNHDYSPISGDDYYDNLANPWEDLNNDILSQNATNKGLFNGNIAMMMTELKHFNNGQNEGIRTMAYKYDALHRIKEANPYTLNGFTWTPANGASNYVYDPNGNLQTLKRAPLTTSDLMDNLTYNYATDSNGDPLNLLTSVSDPANTPAANSPDYLGDVQGTHTYQYDAIGNLISDLNGQSGTDINNIDWTVYGKVSKVENANVEDVEYTYDAAGNRLSKEKVVPGTERTYYVRDASGNVMSIYELNSDNDDNGNIAFQFGDLMQKEVPLYSPCRHSEQNGYIKAPITVALNRIEIKRSC